MLMTAADYRESLRAYKPRVFVNGRAVESVADEPSVAPGINAVGITYEFAHRPEHSLLMTARQGTSGNTVNRMVHIGETSTDLLYKLGASRLQAFGLRAALSHARRVVRRSNDNSR